MDGFLAQKDSYIASAYQQLQVVSQDKTKRLEYEARQKAVWDHNQMMREARERGEERGEKCAEERINKLNLLLMDEERYGDLRRSASDKDFQQQLIREYGI